MKIFYAPAGGRPGKEILARFGGLKLLTSILGRRSQDPLMASSVSPSRKHAYDDINYASWLSTKNVTKTTVHHYQTTVIRYFFLPLPPT